MSPGVGEAASLTSCLSLRNTIATKMILIRSSYLQRFIALICCFRGAVAIAMRTEVEGSILPGRLSSTHNCPDSPKLTCDDLSCQGIIAMPLESIFAKYTCSNQLPVELPGRATPVILAHCRCCPQVLDVSCAHKFCAAADDKFICQAEALRGCVCQTHEPMEDEDEEPEQDQLTQHRGPYLQPDFPPPYTGPSIMELLRDSSLPQHFRIINDALFRVVSGEAGAEITRQSAQHTQSAPVGQEREHQYALSSQTTRSIAIHTGLFFHTPPQPTLFLGAFVLPGHSP